jgi:predicted kinase
MGTLFWMDSPQPIQYAWAMERIDRCEKLIFENVRRLAKLGVPSILDLGFTRTDHREKFATLARGADLPIRLHWIDVPQEERWRRVMQRNRQRGETYEMDVDREMFDFMEGIWEAPTQAEMAALNGIRVAP